MGIKGVGKVGGAPSWGKGGGKGKWVLVQTPIHTVQKPAVGKGKAYSAPSWGKSGGGKSAPSWGKSAPSWGKDGKGKGYKGKGKGKGYNPGAPDASDPFWEEKMAEEDRQDGDGTTFNGTIQNYNIKGGWGFISPDEPSILPDHVQEALANAKAEMEAKGRRCNDENLIYFRKPDLGEGYKAEKGAAVTFQVYTDNKGAGAYDIYG